jgi:hypothetical protein
MDPAVAAIERSGTSGLGMFFFFSMFFFSLSIHQSVN